MPLFIYSLAMNIVPFLLLIGVAAWAWSRTGKVLTTLILDIEKFTINKISLKECIISFNLIAKNSSSKAVNLQGYDLKVIYLDETIATLYQAGLKITVKAHDTTVIKGIKAKISNSVILKGLLDIFNTGNYDNKLKIEGIIKADGLNFPITKTITFTNNDSN